MQYMSILSDLRDLIYSIIPLDIRTYQGRDGVPCPRPDGLYSTVRECFF